MSKRMQRRWSTKSFPSELAKLVLLSLASALMILPGSSCSEEPKLSEAHSMTLGPSAKEKVGEETYQELVRFFHDAERAIEAGNLEELMTLYSEKYTNLDEDKEFAKGVWEQIFANFDDLSSSHSIELLTYDDSSGQTVAVLECTGLLMGTPKGAELPVAVDSWDKQWHVLIKEDRWRLFGNSGESGKRFGAGDQLTHPLF